MLGYAICLLAGWAFWRACEIDGDIPTGKVKNIE